MLDPWNRSLVRGENLQRAIVCYTAGNDEASWYWLLMHADEYAAGVGGTDGR